MMDKIDDKNKVMDIANKVPFAKSTAIDDDMNVTIMLDEDAIDKAMALDKVASDPGMPFNANKGMPVEANHEKGK